MLKTLSVSELSHYVTSIFEAEELLHNVKVYGEVSGLSFVRGNLYFSLKDENALIPCIMFGMNTNSLKEGDQILATGTIKYYAKGGKLNLYVSSAIPYGSGILYQKFIELKNKLEQEGIFSNKYKKQLPDEIKKIGVITSKTGAVVHDIQTVAHRRNPTLNIDVYPAKVQGAMAEQTIIKGLKYFDNQKDIDVIIIARGGGSIEDLQPFNTEELARAIIQTSKPVISAVGHETDFTICDFASSVRAATPSEGAELVSKNLYDYIEKIQSNVEKIFYLTLHLIDAKHEKFEFDLEKLNSLILQKENYESNAFSSIVKNLVFLANNTFINKEHKLVLLHNKIELLNPLNSVNKGWVKIKNSKKYLNSIKDIKKNEEVLVEFKDGKIKTLVTEILGGTN